VPILITAEDMIDENKFGACYDSDLLKKLYDRPLTLLEVLTRNDTPEWKEVKLGDRLWVAERKLNGTEALWTPEEKAALIEALKLRLADFKKDYEEKKTKGSKAFYDDDTRGRSYKDRIENYENDLAEKQPSLSSLFAKDRTCQYSKYGYYAVRDKNRDLVDACIAALTPKETLPCETETVLTPPSLTPLTMDPTASSPVTETTTAPASEPKPVRKVAKPRKPAAKKGLSGKPSAPRSARAKKPS
jgi:hypothetical protein